MIKQKKMPFKLRYLNNDLRFQQAFYSFKNLMILKNIQSSKI